LSAVAAVDGNQWMTVAAFSKLINESNWGATFEFRNIKTGRVVPATHDYHHISFGHKGISILMDDGKTSVGIPTKSNKSWRVRMLTPGSYRMMTWGDR